MDIHEKHILEEHKEYDTITRLDVNRFRIKRGRDSYFLAVDLQGSLGKAHPKGYKGLLGTLRKGKEYSIKELLREVKE